MAIIDATTVRAGDVSHNASQANPLGDGLITKDEVDKILEYLNNTLTALRVSHEQVYQYLNDELKEIENMRAARALTKSEEQIIAAIEALVSAAKIDGVVTDYELERIAASLGVNIGQVQARAGGAVVAQQAQPQGRVIIIENDSFPNMASLVLASVAAAAVPELAAGELTSSAASIADDAILQMLERLPEGLGEKDLFAEKAGKLHGNIILLNQKTQSTGHAA